MSLRYLSMSQLAEVTNKDRRTVKDRLKDIEPHKIDGKAHIYDTHVAIPLILGIGEVSAEQKNRKALAEAELLHERTKAELAVLELERLKKEVVPIEEVAKVVASEYTNVRARILSIPSRCARDLSLESDPTKVKDRLDQEVIEALSELTADTIFQENEHVEQSITTTEANSTEDTKATSETEPSSMG